MNSKRHPTIRVFGQQSIAPSFFNRSVNPWGDSQENEQNKRTKKDSCVSLCDFLDRKLNKSVLYKPMTAEERSRPFTSLSGSKDVAKSSGECTRDKRGREEDKSSAPDKPVPKQLKVTDSQRREEEKSGYLNKAVLEQFKQTNAKKTDNAGPCVASEEQAGGVNEEDQGSRKIKNLFEGIDVKDTVRKPVIVLGDNPKGSYPIQRAQSYSSSKHRPGYNHYANGSGWWDCDMEGVDSEEVGYGEVWEGVGSTTFGGVIDWH